MHLRSAAMDEIKLKIDGKEVTGTAGQTIMEVARENGFHIPHLCYHPKLSKTGACRLCIVRINNTMLKASCTEPGKAAWKLSPKMMELRQSGSGFWD